MLAAVVTGAEATLPWTGTSQGKIQRDFQRLPAAVVQARKGDVIVDRDPSRQDTARSPTTASRCRIGTQRRCYRGQGPAKARYGEVSNDRLLLPSQAQAETTSSWPLTLKLLQTHAETTLSSAYTEAVVTGALRGVVIVAAYAKLSL